MDDAAYELVAYSSDVTTVIVHEVTNRTHNADTPVPAPWIT
jgi:hypothetical protein